MNKLILIIALAVLSLVACKKDDPEPSIPARKIIKQPDIVRDTIIIIKR